MAATISAAETCTHISGASFSIEDITVFNFIASINAHVHGHNVFWRHSELMLGIFERGIHAHSIKRQATFNTGSMRSECYLTLFPPNPVFCHD